MGEEIQAITAVIGDGSGVVQANVPRPPTPARETEPVASVLSAPDGSPPDLGKLLQALGPRLNVGIAYEIDRETKEVIVKVIDKDTKEVLRQVPPEEMVKLKSALRHLFGLLIDMEV